VPSPILNAKYEDIDTPEKRGRYTVCIVGCGQVGVLHAALFAEAGFKVICVDANQIVVNNISKGKASFSGTEIEGRLKNHAKTGRLTATNDLKTAVSQSDVIAVTIPTRIDSKKKADYSNLESVSKRIGPNLRLGSLIVILKLTGIGVTEGVIKETLENSSGFRVGKDFGLAYAPIHTSKTSDLQTAAKARRIVASSDRNSLTASSALLESIMKEEPGKTTNIKVAEAAALFEVQQQDVSLALGNELAFLCEKLSVDYLEVTEFLKRNSETFLPSLLLSNMGVQDEPYLLLSDAENMNVRLRIPATAREVNEKLARYMANLVKDALRSCGKTMRRARVSLLGLSQMPNVKSHPKRIAKEVAQVLTARGVRIKLYDPYFSENDLADAQLQCRKNFTESVDGADCILILTGHDQFKRMSLSKLKILMKMPAAIVDFEGILEPDKVEREGFLYRGLGRGVWTK